MDPTGQLRGGGFRPPPASYAPGKHQAFSTAPPKNTIKDDVTSLNKEKLYLSNEQKKNNLKYRVKYDIKYIRKECHAGHW